MLGILCVLWALYFIRSFTPGRANVDIASQYAQATGAIPFSDWHPPIMAMVWRVLMAITGEQGSLLVLQVGLLAFACWVLGVLVHRLGAPRWTSLLGPAIMLTPWTLSQMTTLWKDTQMAAAMIAAVMLLVIVRFLPRAWVLWIPATVLFVYAIGLRKNAVFAIVPIAVYFGWCLVVVLRRWRSRRRSRAGAVSASGDTGIAAEADSTLPGGTATTGPGAPSPTAPAPRRGRWRMVLATASASVLVLAVFAVGVKATDAAIASQVDVQPTGQISQILLDDVMFSVPDAELMSADAPAELKERIRTARGKCLEMGEIWDSYWNCYGKGETGENFSPIAFQDELKELWLSQVITNPLRYTEYRAAVFSYYFFSSGLEYWPAEWRGSADAVGIDRGSNKADYIFRPYVEDFALTNFPMLFKPWFWALLAAGLLVLVFRWRDRPTFATGSAAPGTPGASGTFAPEITMLAASALSYIFGYFPIVPANHFRYTFWPALAVTVGIVLALAMWRVRKVSASPRRRHSASAEAGALE